MACGCVVNYLVRYVLVLAALDCCIWAPGEMSEHLPPGPIDSPRPYVQNTQYSSFVPFDMGGCRSFLSVLLVG